MIVIDVQQFGFPKTRSHFERLITWETRKFEIFDEIRAFYSNDSNDESEKPH
jgi:hypothetical protein